jgi:hypothetical protein
VRRDASLSATDSWRRVSPTSWRRRASRTEPFCSYFDTKVAIFTAVAQQVVADTFVLLSAPAPLGELLETTSSGRNSRNIRAYREMWFPVGMDFDEQHVVDALALVWTNATAPKPRATRGCLLNRGARWLECLRDVANFCFE